jgi:hypothetical protein
MRWRALGRIRSFHEDARFGLGISHP